MCAENGWIGTGTRWSAAKRAVSLGLLEDHMSHCVLHAAQAGDEEGTAKIREASDAIARLVRS